MNKEIKINFSYVKHKYLVRFFEDGKLKDWKEAISSNVVQKLIAEFYFGDTEKELTPTKA